MFFKSVKKQDKMIDRRRSLEGVPVLNNGVSTVDVGPGRVTVSLRVPRKAGLLARFQPPMLEKNLNLDEIGSFVFGLIDGRRKVIEIIDEFVARYKVNRREAELSNVMFLKSLAERGVISVLIK